MVHPSLSIPMAISDLALSVRISGYVRPHPSAIPTACVGFVVPSSNPPFGGWDFDTFHFLGQMGRMPFNVWGKSQCNLACLGPRQFAPVMKELCIECHVLFYQRLGPTPGLNPDLTHQSSVLSDAYTAHTTYLVRAPLACYFEHCVRFGAL